MVFDYNESGSASFAAIGPEIDDDFFFISLARYADC